MKAMVIETHGGPETFRPVEAPDPAPGDGEVTIAVRASSVNPVDYKIRDGRAARLCPRLPAILHADCAGGRERGRRRSRGLARRRRGVRLRHRHRRQARRAGGVHGGRRAHGRAQTGVPFLRGSGRPAPRHRHRMVLLFRSRRLATRRLGAGARGHGRRWPCRGAARGVARRRGLRDLRQRREMQHRRGPRRAARVQLCGDGPGGDIRRSARGRGVRLCVQHPRRAGDRRIGGGGARLRHDPGHSGALPDAAGLSGEVAGVQERLRGAADGFRGPRGRGRRDSARGARHGRRGRVAAAGGQAAFRLQRGRSAHSHAEHGRPTGKVVLYNDL